MRLTSNLEADRASQFVFIARLLPSKLPLQLRWLPGLLRYQSRRDFLVFGAGRWQR